MNPRQHENGAGMDPHGHPEAVPSAKFSLISNDPEVLGELTAAVERALAMADALELSLVGIDLCSALERIKAIGQAASSAGKHDSDR